ncbi:MAG: hypothetical protein HC919_01075 [Oscillatoriales cyanobacterium SM2_2_1]|nr:hypothetical protein [Oscillatoriales cyanobacterium SM2_2_1]
MPEHLQPLTPSPSPGVGEENRFPRHHIRSPPKVIAGSALGQAIARSQTQ